MTETQPQMCMSEKRRLSLCVGCGCQIHDQYIMRVAPDLEWHAACLRCAECRQYLDESCTCFVRDGKTYCKRDYHRLFGAKCSKCGMSFSRNDFVMRARHRIYHIDCFRCIACTKQLIPGDEFALRDEELFCRAHHHDVFDELKSSPPLQQGLAMVHQNGAPRSLSTGSASPPLTSAASLCSGKDPLQPYFSDDSTHGSSVVYHTPTAIKTEMDSLPPNGNISSNRQSNGVRSQVHKGQHHRGGVGGVGTGGDGHSKPTRVRTVLNEKQLHTLRTCYAANPRPDALMKEQLVEMTGLSPRVIRVWFQNKRCKDKKRQIMMKQMQQNEKDGRPLSLGQLRGVPMVATSPVRHDASPGAPIEVQSYQPPWRALTEFAAMHSGHDIDPSNTHFQHLVHQMHGYDLNHVAPPGPIGPHSYLGPIDDQMHPSPGGNLSSHMPRTPSELSSPPSD